MSAKRDDDEDFELTGCQTAAERTEANRIRAERANDVLELSSDDEAPAPPKPDSDAGDDEDFEDDFEEEEDEEFEEPDEEDESESESDDDDEEDERYGNCFRCGQPGHQAKHDAPPGAQPSIARSGSLQYTDGTAPEYCQNLEQVWAVVKQI